MNYRQLALFVMIFIARPAWCQIFTPDFKYYTSCPTNYSQVNKCTGWIQPTGGTSDYFNECANGSAPVGVPANFAGYQDAADHAYTGMINYQNGVDIDYKEYIGTSFTPLTVGKTYTMTITVSLSDSSNYATDGLGVLFSTYELNFPSHYTTLLVTPQVDYSGYGVLKDKVNWVNLTQTFVADSAYDHLTLGCFKPEATVKIDTLNDGGAGFPFAYYYISQIGIPDANWQPPTDPPPADTIKPVVADTIKYFFPSAFTPNLDGHNDVFRILGDPTNVYKDFSLSIYNRWGQRVFVSRDPATGWDGTYVNTPQEVGVYFYLAEFAVNGKRELLKGDVTLIR
jgi:gliding motility-associated-like protein